MGDRDQAVSVVAKGHIELPSAIVMICKGVMGWETDEFILFLLIIWPREAHTASSRVLIDVADFISYNENLYEMHLQDIYEVEKTHMVDESCLIRILCCILPFDLTVNLGFLG